MVSYAYLSRPDVSRRQHVLHLPWQQKLLELVWNVEGSLGDVQVSDDQGELGWES